MGTCVLLLMEYLSHFLFTKWDKWQKMETQMLLYNDRTARKMNSWDGTLSAFEKVSLMLRIKDGFLVFFVWEFLYLDCSDILGQIVLCCGGLFSRLWDVQEHSWPLPTKCSDRPQSDNSNCLSPDVSNCLCYILKPHHLETLLCTDA